MSKEDPEFRRSQREAFEAVLKALSVVKLDWTKQKLLGELRKHLNISQSTYVELLEKVLNESEVKSSKGEGEFGGSLREALHEAGGLAGAPRRPTYASENDTDTENDEDYRKDDEGDDDDRSGTVDLVRRLERVAPFSSSEGSTSRPTKGDPKRRHNKTKDRNRRRAQMKSKRKDKKKGRSAPRDSMASGGRPDANPIARDEVVQYEVRHAAGRSQPNRAQQMTGAAGSRFDLAVAKPPYEKDVFEAFLINGTLDELREMTRQVKRQRQTLINVMLEDNDPTVYPENDLVQKILLREKNVRQQKALENELRLLDSGR